MDSVCKCKDVHYLPRFNSVIYVRGNYMLLHFLLFIISANVKGNKTFIDEMVQISHNYFYIILYFVVIV